MIFPFKPTSISAGNSHVLTILDSWLSTLNDCYVSGSAQYQSEVNIPIPLSISADLQTSFASPREAIVIEEPIDSASGQPMAVTTAAKLTATAVSSLARIVEGMLAAIGSKIGPVDYLFLQQ